LTANAIQGTKEMFYEHGFQAFISKPIDIMELDSVIRKWVRNESKGHSSIANETASTVSRNDEDNNEDNNENPAIDIPGVDTEMGLSFYGGDLDIYVPTLLSYTINTPEALDKLRTVSEETLPEYVINVHGLKGTSASIGAEKIREAAADLEKIAKAGDLQGVLAKNDMLIKQTENILANIKAWLEKHDEESSEK